MHPNPRETWPLYNTISIIMCSDIVTLYLGLQNVAVAAMLRPQKGVKLICNARNDPRFLAYSSSQKALFLLFWSWRKPWQSTQFSTHSKQLQAYWKALPPFTQATVKVTDEGMLMPRTHTDVSFSLRKVTQLYWIRKHSFSAAFAEIPI